MVTSAVSIFMGQKTAQRRHSLHCQKYWYHCPRVSSVASSAPTRPWRDSPQGCEVPLVDFADEVRPGSGDIARVLSAKIGVALLGAGSALGAAIHEESERPHLLRHLAQELDSPAGLVRGRHIG